jgi:hypothetical protein
MTSFLINPYRFVSAAALWTPAQITTALWLDAGDSSTVTTVSGAVSQWNDKSGNSRNATQGTAGSRPTYTTAGQNGLNVLTFDGSNDSLALASDLSLGTAHTIFAVVKPSATITSSTSVQAIASGGSFSNSTTSEFLFVAGSVTGNLTDERLSSLVVADSGSGAQVYGYGKTNADVSGAFILGSAFTTSSNQFTGRLNGSADLATVSSPGGYSSTSTRYPTFLRGIGYRYSNAAQFWNGQYDELIVVPSYASLATIEQLEGYLAHKWGLTGNLPAGHPYKSAPPYV